MSNSRFPGFYKQSPNSRRQTIASQVAIPESEYPSFDASSLSMEAASVMVENVIGTFALPLATAVNFRYNGQDIIIPMVIEEPSVLAAVSNVARLVRQKDGFIANTTDAIMIGQVQLRNIQDPAAVLQTLEKNKAALIASAQTLHPRLQQRGGGIRGMEFRHIRYDEPGEKPEDMIVLHFYLDCVDAMGANMINSIAEHLSPMLTKVTGEKVGLRILSNFATKRLAKASCSIPISTLSMSEVTGMEVAQGIANAYRFAYADPYRAATHNKGIMNGVDALALATGNDWRAIEAGAHAWAARSGQYRPLTKWKIIDQTLHGSIELPMQVGTVGGCIQNHPQVRTNLQILGNPNARELSSIMAVIGLAQNLAALRALATEGIQRGHMRMHARNVAARAGATSDEINGLVERLFEHRNYSLDFAKQQLDILRSRQ